jgi:Xaa-Pro aminopeptidase
MTNALGARRVRVLEKMVAHRPEVEALLVTTPENRRYLTGFTGSWGMAVLASAELVLITDGRYVEQAAAEAPGSRIVRHGADPLPAVKEVVQNLGATRIGFEKENMTVGMHQRLQTALEGVTLVPTEGLVEGVRMIKERGELDLIRQAAAMTDAVLADCLHLIRPGATEREVAIALEFEMKRRGAGPAFEIIVVSGPRSSLPHGRPSSRAMATGDLVTVDLGVQYQGYCSDLTRTFAIGHADARQREVYAVVLAAQTAALEGLRPGMTGKEADGLARSIIEQRGYGEQFGHGLGHGVGLAIHEGPRMSLTGDAPLPEGCVVTLEPGVYLPGWGGVRIEDLVILRSDGAERLSNSPRELKIL